MLETGCKRRRLSRWWSCPLLLLLRVLLMLVPVLRGEGTAAAAASAAIGLEVLRVRGKGLAYRHRPAPPAERLHSFDALLRVLGDLPAADSPFTVPLPRLKEALDALPAPQRDALRRMAGRVTAFATAQRACICFEPAPRLQRQRVLVGRREPVREAGYEWDEWPRRRDDLSNFLDFLG